jgi:PKD repeat protein
MKIFLFSIIFSMLFSMSAFAQPSCNAHFTTTNSWGPHYNCERTTNQGDTYSWTLNGQPYTPYYSPFIDLFPFHLTTGTYVICLTVVNGTCTDTYCETIVSTCHSDFYVGPTGNVTNEFQIRAANYLNSQSATYNWTLNGTSIGTDSTFLYNLGPGMNILCLTVQDGACTSTQCDTINNVNYGCNAQFEILYNSQSHGFGNYTNYTNNSTFTWTVDGLPRSETSYYLNETFTTIGVHTICLTVSNATCIGSYCEDITVTNVVAPTCSAQFTYIQSGNIFDFYGIYIPNTSYQWTINGQLNNSNAPQIQEILNAGVNTVCLTTVNGTCTDTQCQTIYLSNGGTGICDANFSTTHLGRNQYMFGNSSTNQGHWIIDGQNGSTQTHVWYETFTPGNHIICLALNGCLDIVCDTIIVNNLPCDASFNAQPTFQNTNEFVFYALHYLNSSNATYSWTINGNVVSTDTLFVHTLAQGINIICLTVVDGACTSNGCDTINNVNYDCNAHFIHYGFTGGSNNATYSFYGNAFPNSTYSWTVNGQARSETTNNFAETFNSNGIYSICLTVSNATCTDTYCQDFIVSGINLTPASCSAQFTYFQSGNIFDFYGIPAPNASYQWTINGQLNNSNAPQIHEILNAGVYQVCLTIVNGTCTDTQCQAIDLSNGNPGSCNAQFNYTQSGNIFGFYGRYTPNASYQWTINGQLNNSNAPQIQEILNAGVYQVCLTIVNGTCTDTQCQAIDLSNGNPGSCNAQFTYIQSGNIFDFYGQYTPNGSYQWTINGQPSNANNSQVQEILNAGVYQVCLTIVNGNCTDTQCQTIILSNGNPCQALFTPDSSHIQSDTLFGINHSIGVGRTFTWDFGDGTTSNLPFPVHTYSQIGTYVVCMTVYDSILNCSATYCDTIGVDSLGHVIFRGITGFTFVVNPPATTAVLTPIDANAMVHIFPNPANDYLNIEHNFDGEVNLSVYNLVGVNVMNTLETNQSIRLNTSDLASGVYILNISHKNGRKTMKFVKE